MTQQTGQRGRWQHRARCRGLDLDLFIPEGKVGSEARLANRRAAQYCAHCPVVRQCLELALRAEGSAPAQNRFGVYGGLTPDQRHDLYRRRMGQQAAA